MFNLGINLDSYSEESYQSDDFVINFIAGYIIACPDARNSEYDFRDQDDCNVGLAYIDEPVADKDW